MPKPTPKTIQCEMAEKVGKDFAKEVNRSYDDPIVKQLVRDVKRSLGYRRWRNTVEAERTSKQPGLFEARTEQPATAQDVERSAKQSDAT